jgi:hypothetical protein
MEIFLVQAEKLWAIIALIGHYCFQLTPAFYAGIFPFWVSCGNSSVLSLQA